MQIPRDLSSRMIDAAERAAAIDVYERLMPESQRVNQRVDWIAWWTVCAGVELQAAGLAPGEMALLRDVEADPAARWALVGRWWPCLRTTDVGRMTLRVAWELYGIENIDSQTWKSISARLWAEAESGFYERTLCGRANVRWTLVDREVDASTRSCCVPLKSCDHLLSISTREQMVSWFQALDPPAALKLEGLDTTISQWVQEGIEQKCAGFKMGTLPDVSIPSIEEVSWAFNRVVRREGPAAVVEPDLQSYVGHRLLATIARSGLSLQVHVRGDADIARLRAWAKQYPQVRFLGVYGGEGDSYSLSMLGRTLPNVALALVHVWNLVPVLRQWIHRVPLNKILALAGGLPMVEAVCVQAILARERIAMLLAEMVTSGELDQEDALMAIERLLCSNAESYYMGGGG